MIDLHGPYWQFECGICGDMSDVYETEDERDMGAALHTCHFNLRLGHPLPEGTYLNLPGMGEYEYTAGEWREVTE